MRELMKVAAIYKTCHSCPSQWQGVLETGHGLYIRYRWGCIRVDVEGHTIFQRMIGDDLDGYLSDDDMMRYAKRFLDFSHIDGITEVNWYDDVSIEERIDQAKLKIAQDNAT